MHSTGASRRTPPVRGSRPQAVAPWLVSVWRVEVATATAVGGRAGGLHRHGNDVAPGTAKQAGLKLHAAMLLTGPAHPAHTRRAQETPRPGTFIQLGGRLVSTGCTTPPL
jgi:hypothetical protein